MNEKIIKRSYNFPPELLAMWEKFHAPSKDYSPSASAAFLLYMVVDPSIREEFRKLAHQAGIKKVMAAASESFRRNVAKAYLTGFLDSLPEDKKNAVLAASLQAEELLTGNPKNH